MLFVGIDAGIGGGSILPTFENFLVRIFKFTNVNRIITFLVSSY